MTKELLDNIVSIANLLTPVLLAFLGGMGWLIQNKLATILARQEGQTTRIRELEDKLREDRIATYNALLEPFFLFFSSEVAFATDQKYKGKKKDDIAISRMLSVEFGRVGRLFCPPFQLCHAITAYRLNLIHFKADLITWRLL